VYRLIRPLLFKLGPERAHRLTLAMLRGAYRIPLAPRMLRAVYAARTAELPVTVMGLTLANPLGLAAGLDKNAECVTPLRDLGFGAIELGTVTPRPQPGNPKPRMFRLPAHDAVINRMGFNSAGLERFTSNLTHAERAGVVIGANIGKNADTPIDRALDDYLAGMRAVYALADYIAVNISSPNTRDLRTLQERDALGLLLGSLAQEKRRLARQHGRAVPLAVKIAPDLDAAQIAAVAGALLDHGMDGVIATNTTVARPGLAQHPLSHESGGLSGRPLREMSTSVVRALYAEIKGRIPIIGVGGISSADDAWERLVAGADALQVYTALIYRGPALVRDIVNGLALRTREAGCATLTEAVARARSQ
jgi:dihydroorotate dehydrogenase